MTTPKEGNLQAPTRHPIDWKNPDYFNEESLNKELERVFDICHGCRRCGSLCQSFPVLFDLVDESDTMEVDGVKKEDYTKVVDQCYMCDLCYMTKCPYVPPHEWNVDFPHLMLRAKAIKYKKGNIKIRDKVLTSTDNVGKFAGIPIVAPTINAINKFKPARKGLELVAGIHSKAWLPKFESNNLFLKEFCCLSKSDELGIEITLVSTLNSFKRLATSIARETSDPVAIIMTSGSSLGS